MKKKPTHGTGDLGPRAPDDAEQSRRFKDKAQEIEADDTGGLFNRALGSLLPTRLQPKKPRAKPE